MRTRVGRLVIGLGIALAFLAGQAALTAFQGQGAFVPLSDADLAKRETMPAAPLVFYAYAFVWVAVLTYVYVLWRRIGRVQRELDEVTARLNAGGATRGR